jgi:glycosyltransferase involved in cell wall biosynthesis
MKAVLVTNIPSPYRVALFDEIEKQIDFDFVVIYCAYNENNRMWAVPELNHKNIFLKEESFTLLKKTNFYWRIDIIRVLKYLNPDVIVTAGFNPVMIFAFLYSKINSKRHIVFSDSWKRTIQDLTFIHKSIRRIVFKFSSAFVVPGNKGREYFLSSGIKDSRIFTCPLGIDNEAYQKHQKTRKIYDIIFSGQFIQRKMPFFFIEVLKTLKTRKSDLRVLIIGSGELEAKFIWKLNQEGINYYFPGFIQPENISRYYAESKILLFPTLSDPWGIVANEACAVGTPVITCENAGVAGDLIIHDYNGFILPLDINIWAEHIIRLLKDKELYNKFSENCLLHVKNYSPVRAAGIFINAFNFALCNPR